MNVNWWPATACTAILALGHLQGSAIAGEELAGSWYEPQLMTSIVISEDCQGIAFLRRFSPANDNSVVFINGQVLSGGFIPAMTLSPDGQRVAWMLRTPRDEWYLRQNDKSQARYDELIPLSQGMIFSPDSKHLAFAARWDKQWFVVLDGRETPAGGAPPSNLRFSPDSQRLAYVLSSGGKKRVVVDGQQSQGYADIRNLQFSDDSKRIAYIANLVQDQWVAVIDGIVKSEAYASIDGFRISRDGSRWGLSAHKKGASGSKDDYFVVLDGVETRSFNQNLFGPVFSDDAKHAIFVVTKAIGDPKQPNFNYIAALDGQAKDPFRFVQEAAYSPDGTRLAMITCGNFSPGSMPAFRYALTVDGKDLIGGDLSANAGFFGCVTFSPDGKRIACATRGPLIDIDHTDFRWSIYVDGEKGPLYRSVAPIVFSPDSKHYAYAAQKENTWIMVLDGKELPYELLRPTVDGGPDGRWKTVPVPEINWPPMIPQQGPRREDFDVAQIPYRFDKENRLSFFGIRDGKLFKISAAN